MKTQSGTRTKRQKLGWIVTLGFVLTLVSVTAIWAHNLQTRMVYMFFDPETQACIDARLEVTTPYPPPVLLLVCLACRSWAPGQPVLQVGDELGIIIKVIPRDGTTTGVGGHIDFYVPEGVEVVDVGYVIPNGAGGYDKAAMKGQSPIAVGAGPIGAKATASSWASARCSDSTASGAFLDGGNPAAACISALSPASTATPASSTPPTPTRPTVPGSASPRPTAERQATGTMPIHRQPLRQPRHRGAQRHRAERPDHHQQLGRRGRALQQVGCRAALWLGRQGHDLQCCRAAWRPTPSSTTPTAAATPPGVSPAASPARRAATHGTSTGTKVAQR